MLTVFEEPGSGIDVCATIVNTSRTGIVDADRILVLRTASNFTMQPPGKSAVWSKTTPYPDRGRPALESAFVVGNTVVQASRYNAVSVPTPIS